jgi:hypothetical protein
LYDFVSPNPREIDDAAIRLAHLTLFPSFEGDRHVGLRDVNGEDLVIRLPRFERESLALRTARCRIAIEETLAERDGQAA